MGMYWYSIKLEVSFDCSKGIALSPLNPSVQT